ELGTRWGYDSGALGRLLPQLADLEVGPVVRRARDGLLHAWSRAAGARCSQCAMPSSRVHGRYVRRLREVPLGGTGVAIEVTVRRFARALRPGWAAQLRPPLEVLCRRRAG